MIPASDRRQAVALIQEANRNGARLAKACEELNLSVRTYERWTAKGQVKEDQRPLAERPTPKNKLTKEERAEILRVVSKKEFMNLPPSQIVPKLADQAIYIASESSIYRVLREEKMQNHRGRSQAPQKRLAPSHLASRPNEVWTWDITWLKGPVKGLFYRLYLIIDLFSRKMVGWEIWETEEARYAEQLIQQTVIKEQIQGQPLVLHSDNGSPMKAATFQVLLEKLGIQSSYSRPRVSNDNPYSEAVFRTLKYRPEYPDHGFKTLDDAREWTHTFVDWYNHAHLHSGIQFVSPAECHEGRHIAILEKRKQVYECAKKRHPERWSKGIRNWSPHQSVALNPLKEREKQN